jgi:hypothetical protein
MPAPTSTPAPPNAINGGNSFARSYCRSFSAIDDKSVFVLGSDSRLWLELGPFGTAQQTRQVIDGNVQAYQWVDGLTAYVLGLDGNLWLEHSNPHSANNIWSENPREHVDGNVQAFQALDAETVFVLGKDGKLWLERAGANGKFGQVPPPRTQVNTPTGAAVTAFQAIDADDVYVLDSNQALWLLQAPFKYNTAPLVGPISYAVSSFQAADTDTVFFIDTANLLYLQRATTGSSGRSWLSESINLFPPPGNEVSGNVQAVQPLQPNPQADGSVVLAAYVLDNNPDHLVEDSDASAVTGGFGLTRYVWVWSPDQPLTAKLTAAIPQDYNVMDFQVLGSDVMTLGRDGNLWLVTGPLSVDTLPEIPQRVHIDGNVASPTAYGTGRPQFAVIDLIYAPPGTQGGKSQSSVTYTTDSTTGVTTEATQSFKEGLDVKASVGSDVTGSVSADFSVSQTDTNSLSIKAETDVNNSISWPGPPQDGINHYYDVFYVWLNPQVHTSVDTLNNLGWQLGSDGDMSVVEVYAGELLGVIPWHDASIKAKLDAAQLNQSSYSAILSVNPFTPPPSLQSFTAEPPPPPNYQPSSLDPNRFHPLSVPPELQQYSGPLQQGASPPLDTYTVSNTNDTTSSNETESQLGLTVSYSSPGISGPITASFSMSASFQWTYTNKQSVENKTTQSASVKIGGAAYGYNGPSTLNVYWDTLFNTFAFELV